MARHDAVLPSPRRSKPTLRQRRPTLRRIKPTLRLSKGPVLQSASSLTLCVRGPLPLGEAVSTHFEVAITLS